MLVTNVISDVRNFRSPRDQYAIPYKYGQSTIMLSISVLTALKKNHVSVNVAISIFLILYVELYHVVTYKYDQSVAIVSVCVESKSVSTTVKVFKSIFLIPVLIEPVVTYIYHHVITIFFVESCIFQTIAFVNRSIFITHGFVPVYNKTYR